MPNEYAIYLSPEDRERFAAYEGALRDELAGYLLEHARGERFALLSRPVIEFRTDDRLGLGEFGIQARLGAGPRPTPAAEAAQGDSGHTMVYSAAERLAGAARGAGAHARASAALLGTRASGLDDRRRRRGRSAAGATARSCSPTPTSPASHAEIRPRGGGWVARRPRLDERRARQRRRGRPARVLASGDEIELGTTTVTFALE